MLLVSFRKAYKIIIDNPNHIFNLSQERSSMPSLITYFSLYFVRIRKMTCGHDQLDLFWDKFKIFIRPIDTLDLEIIRLYLKSALASSSWPIIL